MPEPSAVAWQGGASRDPVCSFFLDSSHPTESGCLAEVTGDHTKDSRVPCHIPSGEQVTDHQTQGRRGRCSQQGQDGGLVAWVA